MHYSCKGDEQYSCLLSHRTYSTRLHCTHAVASIEPAVPHHRDYCCSRKPLYLSHAHQRVSNHAPLLALPLLRVAVSSGALIDLTDRHSPGGRAPIPTQFAKQASKSGPPWPFCQTSRASACCLPLPPRKLTDSPGSPTSTAASQTSGVSE